MPDKEEEKPAFQPSAPTAPRVPDPEQEEPKEAPTEAPQEPQHEPEHVPSYRDQ